MRILIDGVVFENHYQRGIQRYFRELLGRIGKVHPVDLYLSATAQTELPQNCTVTMRTELLGTHHLNYPKKTWRRFRRRFAPTKFSGHTLFHSTYFTSSLEPDLPNVTTVYDLIPERFETKYKQWGQEHIDKKRRCMEGAQKIICISHATANDVADIYPHLKSKLCVTQLGADHFETRDLHEPDAKDPYLLQIGDRHGYKNFDAVFKAMGESNWPAELKVVIAGPHASDQERELLKSTRLESRVRWEGPVSDSVMRDLLRKATGFIFPSTYEGFGFPLLEAQSQGTPVLCSDIAVFHETAGETALFFDPHDPAAIAGAANQLMNGAAAEKRVAGLTNVGRFRWDQCTRLTTEIYQSVSKGD